MSTAKRPRQRQSDVRPAVSSHPAKKPRLSATPTGLGALVDGAGKGRKAVNARLSNGVKDVSNNHINENKAAVASQLQAEHDVDMKDEISESDAASSAGSDGGDEKPQSLTNGVTNGTAESNGLDSHRQDGDEAGSAALVSATDPPSFGDMLLAKYPNAIDVPSTLTNQSRHATALVPADNSRNLQPPPATSLGTVLTQALKTSDNELLESCLQMNDIASIRSTIQRLQSPLIAKLMLKLAERIHKRPGRAGLLMRWIQWSLVAHGGYLASQPELVHRLRALFQVVRERANSLQPLMMLKGKLDMLSAQVELRRDLRRPQPAGKTQDDDYENIDGNDDVVYVEGQDESSSSEDETEPGAIVSKSKKRQDTEDDDIVVNGVNDSESSESDAEGLGDLIDDEAIESEGEELSDASEDEEDEDSMDGDEDAIDDEEDGDDDDEVEPADPPSGKRGGPLRRESLATKRPSRASLSGKRK